MVLYVNAHAGILFYVLGQVATVSFVQYSCCCVKVANNPIEGIFVAVLQAAHVGVGISGVEGLQAASASDYAIAQVTQHYVFIVSLIIPME